MHTPEGGLSYTLPFTAFKRENIINGRWSTMKTKEKPMFSRLSLSWRQRDSNPRPLRCERNALPAELCPRPNCYHYSTTGMNCK